MRGAWRIVNAESLGVLQGVVPKHTRLRVEDLVAKRARASVGRQLARDHCFACFGRTETRKCPGKE